MSVTTQESDLLKRIDKLHEFERNPVTPDRFESPRHFAAVFAGEHVAGTEFVIGAVFVSWGVPAKDLVLGLLVGNLLAVLSWVFICAPIAVQTRLTLYWYLRKIAGPVVTALYNVLNAVLFCILSGTMITVSASAVRIPFGIPPQTKWYPDDARFVLIALIVGTVVTTIAMLGFRRLAQFSMICVPWIFVMFIAGAVAVLSPLTMDALGTASPPGLAGLWQIAEQTIWVGSADSTFGFWHVTMFAWICNLAFHVGLSDMAVLRYAPNYKYGLFSACGMYLGHFLAWMCAGIMGAGAALLLKIPLTELDAGGVAYQALGFAGAICVVLSGWATSNPTLYRAGLALQAVTPGWPRWFVTLMAGVVTTIVSCFPFVFSYLLDFVALFGILLAPVGAMVFVEHWIFPRIGLRRYWFEAMGGIINWPALITWGLAVCGALAIATADILHLFFIAVPLWFASAIFYSVLSAFYGAAQQASSKESAVDAKVLETPSPSSVALKPTHAGQPSSRDLVRIISGLTGAASLLTCLGLTCWMFYFDGDGYEKRITAFHSYLAVASVVHLGSAAVWVLYTERSNNSHSATGSENLEEHATAQA